MSSYQPDQCKHHSGILTSHEGSSSYLQAMQNSMKWGPWTCPLGEKTRRIIGRWLAINHRYPKKIAKSSTTMVKIRNLPSWSQMFKITMENGPCVDDVRCLSHWKLWFSIAALSNQRLLVHLPRGLLCMPVASGCYGGYLWNNRGAVGTNLWCVQPLVDRVSHVGLWSPASNRPFRNAISLHHRYRQMLEPEMMII